MFFDALVAAQQERQEHRADVIDAAEVEDKTGGGVSTQRRQHYLGRLLHQVFRHSFHFRRRGNDGYIAVPFYMKRLVLFRFLCHDDRPLRDKKSLLSSSYHPVRANQDWFSSALGLSFASIESAAERKAMASSFRVPEIPVTGIIRGRCRF